MKLINQIKTALLAKKILAALPDPEIMKEKFLSRKLWAAVIGAALTAFGTNLGVDPGMVDNLVNLLMVYIVGQAGVDIVDKVAVAKKG